MAFKSTVKLADLKQLDAKVYAKGVVDREHLLEFLTLVPTNDSSQIIEEVKQWLTALHLNPKFDKIKFPSGHIDAVLTDLDSYGRVQPETILQLKQQYARTSQTP